MKSLFILTSALLFTANVLAENDPLWMRYPAISPNGETIAFTYKGDIYTVPANGGKATQLTTHPAHDTRPIWSPDGSKIAFASDRNGNFDIFIMDMEGGSPKQLTTHSANEYPETFSDAKHILYSAAIQQDAKDSQFPSGQFPQIYRIGINGGRPELYSSLAMESLALNKKGDKLLYQDKKGYEDPWRKHHQSSITRDIWLCTLDREHSFQKITSFKGEDRNPVWATDGSSFYYLSEEKGSFNIFKNDLTGRNSRQITNHTMHPVRFLTSDNNGNLCYGYDGEIYTVLEASQNKTARSAMVVKAKVRNVRTGSNVELSWGGGEKVEPAQIEKREMQYLYDTDEAMVFMDNETYDQVEIPMDRLKWERNFIVPNSNVNISSYEGEILGVILPDKATLKVVECEQAVKGDTATSASKNAVLETGLEVKVPLFINQDEMIVVNTNDGKYSGRAK